MKINRILQLGLCILLFQTACTRTVTRVNPNQTIDLSGRWNDTDARLVSEEMVKDVLARPWREAFFNKNQKKPTMIVGIVTNKSSEFIDADVFIKNLEKEFINSGLVRVVDNGTFREALRKERADQQQYASPDTQAKWGKELGANFMLFGTINSITDTYKNKKVVFYKINLWLTDMESNEKVWLGDKEIKKFVEN